MMRKKRTCEEDLFIDDNDLEDAEFDDLEWDKSEHASDSGDAVDEANPDLFDEFSNQNYGSIWSSDDD